MANDDFRKELSENCKKIDMSIFSFKNVGKQEIKFLKELINEKAC